MRALNFDSILRAATYGDGDTRHHEIPPSAVTLPSGSPSPARPSGSPSPANSTPHRSLSSSTPFDNSDDVSGGAYSTDAESTDTSPSESGDPSSAPNGPPFTRRSTPEMATSPHDQTSCYHTPASTYIANTERLPSLAPTESGAPSTPQRQSLRSRRSDPFEYSASRSVTPRSPATPISLAERPTGVIDFVVFPTVFDAILNRCDSETLMLMRKTCRAVQAVIDPRLYRDIQIAATEDGMPLGVYSRGSKPRLRSTLVNLANFAHTRAIDLHGDLPSDVFGLLAPNFTNVETVRLFPDGMGRCVDKCPVPTENLVIVGEPRMPKTDPGADHFVMTTPLKRVIIHIQSLDDTNALWYHQLLYPYGTQEVVIVFTDWTKPFTPKAAARGRATRRRDTASVHARFTLLATAIEHIITKEERRYGYIKCTIVDIGAVDPDWFGLSQFVPIARRLRDEVYLGLGRWRSDAEADVASSFLQFMSAAQWQASLLAEEDSA